MKTRIYKVFVPESCQAHFENYLIGYGYRHEIVSEYRTQSLFPQGEDLDKMLQDGK